jgi:hypothetical protein
MSESYDKECCKQECECPEGSTIECEDSSTESNYEVLAKLFKDNDDPSSVKIEGGLGEEGKKEVAELLQDTIASLNKIFESHRGSQDKN